MERKLERKGKFEIIGMDKLFLYSHLNHQMIKVNKNVWKGIIFFCEKRICDHYHLHSQFVV